MRFHDVTIQLTGDQRSERIHESRDLVPAAVEVFRDLIERHGTAFTQPIPFGPFARISLQWTEDARFPGTALATFRTGGATILTHSLLLTGQDRAAETLALADLQGIVTRLWRGTALEPGFAIAGLDQRPAIVSIPICNHDDIGVVADMETCLAAAYFELSEAKGSGAAGPVHPNPRTPSPGGGAGTIETVNHGALIISSTYWESLAAKRGDFHLSTNAGTFRLLVPPAHVGCVDEMRTGKSVILSRGPWSRESARRFGIASPAPDGGDALELLFEDGTDNPFSIHLQADQCDRLPLDSDAGREFVFTAWLPPRRGKPHMALTRPCHYRRVRQIPYLMPLRKGTL